MQVKCDTYEFNFIWKILLAKVFIENWNPMTNFERNQAARSWLAAMAYPKKFRSKTEKIKLKKI